MPNFRIFRVCNDRTENLWVPGDHARIMKTNALVCEYVCQLYAYK